jgi:hypothetical protein
LDTGSPPTDTLLLRRSPVKWQFCAAAASAVGFRFALSESGGATSIDLGKIYLRRKPMVTMNLRDMFGNTITGATFKIVKPQYWFWKLLVHAHARPAVLLTCRGGASFHRECR